jgi:hypothetical protein
MTLGFAGWLWLMSGLPVGLVLMLFAPGMVTPLVVAIMVLETAHVVSPVLLAWTRPGLRSMVSREWVKHIAAPAAVMTGVLVVPAAWTASIYWMWNIYHFGMQNFGVSSLCWQSHKVIRKWLCLGITAFGMGALPWLTHDPQVNMLCMGMFSFNHWIVDIGLSSRVARWHWLFLGMF